MEHPISTRLWDYLAPGDRETLMAGIVAWLMDPRGTHGFGTQFLEYMLGKLDCECPAPEAVRIGVEQKSGRNRRFDIQVDDADGERLAVIEVKAKSFGSLRQLEEYADDCPVVGRLGFDDWHWTLDEQDEARFPLVTFTDVAEKLRELEEQRNAPRPIIDELREFLERESSFFAGLHDYYISEKPGADRPVSSGSDQRLSQRFYNGLYWRWFHDKRQKETGATDGRSRNQTSGVWYIFDEIDSKVHGIRLSGIGIDLPAVAKSWVHVELFSGRSIHAETERAIGKIQLRVAGEDESAKLEIWKALKDQKEAIEKAGFRIPGKRPRESAGSWNPLTRHLHHRDFRYSALMRIIGTLNREQI